MEPASLKLKEATSAAHRSLDTNLRLIRLLAGDLTRGEYLHVLERFAGFFTPLEAAVKACLSATSVPALLRERYAFMSIVRSAKIDDDRLVLGDVRPPACCAALPELSTWAHALGALYVMEGSALGGRVIARQLERSLGLGRASGASFFTPESDEALRKRWIEVRRLLDTWLQDEASYLAARDAATATFAALGRWLDF